MHRGFRISRFAGVALSGLIAMSCLASDGRYDDHSLLDVDVRTPKQLRTLEATECVILNCKPGLGTMRVVASPDALKVLDTLKIQYVRHHDDVQELIDEERRRIGAHNVEMEERGFGGDDWYLDFKTWPQINDRIDTLEGIRPDLVDQFIIGTSLQGRDIHAFSIGAGADKPVLIFNGCQHAREWASPMTVMYIAEQFVINEDTDPDVAAILDTFEIVIIPVVNPDGYEHTYALGGNRLWRKNRRNNGDGTTGVDLNRNWSVGWGGGGSSGSGSSDIYRGTAPFSEPETTALSNYILSRPNAVAHIDFHTFSQLILWPYGYQFEEPTGIDLEIFTGLGNLMADAIFDVHGETYVPQAGHDLYQASGVCPDWAYDEAGVYSWTFELRDEGTFGFELPPDQIIPCGEENYAAIKALGLALLSGVQFDATLPDIIESGMTTDVAMSISPISSGDLDNGSAQLTSRINGGAWSSTSIAHNGGASFTAMLPAADCDDLVEYYVTIDALSGTTYSWPVDAPDSMHSATAKDIDVSFEDDFESASGWSVANSGGLTDGAWERGVPVDGNRGDPTSDYDGSGQCYVTDNVAGNSDVDNGTTTLTSPVMDASNPDSVLSYARWYSNTEGSSPMTDIFVVEASDDGGASWHEVETVGPAGAEVNGGWYHVSFVIADIPGITNTSDFRVRFHAQDADPGSVVEAGIDAVAVRSIGCDTSAIPGDLDNSGTVDTTDLLMMLGAWGECDDPCPPACIGDVDGDCVVGTTDLLTLLANWN